MRTRNIYFDEIIYPDMKKEKELKVALVHDFLMNYGGAERVLEAIAEIFPGAPIYTLLYDEEKMRGKLSGREIIPSYLQKFPKWIRKRHRLLVPFFMVVPETLDFRDYDLVISSSGAWTKGIITKLSTSHVAYLHSPMRFVWDYNERYLKEERRGVMNFFARFFFNYIRTWDKVAADRPDHIISNSRYTRDRILKYYKRESSVIYPPASGVLGVTEDIFKDKGDFFLIVSRLSPYKKVELAVETFNKLGLPLIISGEGRQKKYLKKIAGKNVKILGWQSDRKIKELYSRARALIFAGEDDFGMTMVEAMSCGTPVIAYDKGGAREIVEEGVTGEFFRAQTVEVLADGVRRFIENEKGYNRETILKSAEKFSKQKFKSELKGLIDSIIDNQ